MRGQRVLMCFVSYRRRNSSEETRVGFRRSTNPNRSFSSHGTMTARWSSGRSRTATAVLLQAILAQEGMEDHRFWIITAPENHASARGIEKAGFTNVAQLAFTNENRAGLVATDSGAQRGRAGAAVLGVPSSQPMDGDAVSPCWSCVNQALRHSSRAAC